MQEQISDNGQSTFWYYISLIAAQFNGMKTGYALTAPQDQVGVNTLSLTLAAVHIMYT